MLYERIELKQGDWMNVEWKCRHVLKKNKKKEWMESGVTMQTFLKQRDWMGSVKSDMQTRGQYRHFVRGHQRRRRWYERLCRRFGDLSQICQYCQFVNIVSRPRWLNNLKYCWLNIKLPWTYWGQRENKQNRDPKRLNSKRMHRKPKSKIYMKA